LHRPLFGIVGFGWPALAFWLPPVWKEETDMPKEVTLRYRFRLIPYGQ
jgi:hypothetical protein